jgi:four helix bundle protein
MPFRKLQVWEKSMALAKSVYRISQSFPAHEQYGLTSQMRRAAISIASNIAEGSQRSTDKDFANFVQISRGSLAELETQLLLSKEMGYLSDQEATTAEYAIDELGKMLNAFHSKLIATR